MDLLHILRADLVVSNEKQARFAKWGQLVMPEVKLAIWVAPAGVVALRAGSWPWLMVPGAAAR